MVRLPLSFTTVTSPSSVRSSVAMAASCGWRTRMSAPLVSYSLPRILPQSVIAQTLESAMQAEKPARQESFWWRCFARRNFRSLLRLHQVLRQAAEEKLQLLCSHRLGQWVAQIIDMRMILGRIVPAFFALGDAVVLEGDAIFVALHDHQFPPPPGHMHAQRKLVSPAGDAMDD